MKDPRKAREKINKLLIEINNIADKTDCCVGCIRNHFQNDPYDKCIDCIFEYVGNHYEEKK